ncbi:MAG TPA: helix-turn-helix domain-containing GNAT family N-acetyltransferase [Gemmatimonadaceae bacterium]|nr:helix-turn-helix domain-containing GNAT family N-acetyltransferase [Gemmatimonadaceae bacterium]
MPREPDSAAIAAIRGFNRVYTRRIGVLDEGHLHTPWSLAEGRVLYELAHREAPTATEVGEALGLDPGYLSRILRKFDHHGLITRERSSIDARRTHLRLTKKGAREFARLDQLASDDVAAMLAGLSPLERRRLLSAAETMRSVIAPESSDRTSYRLRRLRVGDIGWIAHRQAVLYHEEYGWNEHYESLIARIMADFVDNFKPDRERCWIAERHGEIVGSIFVVEREPKVAQLRLLYVEPSARGLGIGTRLVKEVIKFARKAGYEKVVLWTNDVLVSARKIYQAEGFTLASQEPNDQFGPAMHSQFWELLLTARA